MPRKKQTVEEYNQMNPKAVMERLGHAKSNVTMEIYAHVNNETRKKSADLIEEIIVKATE